MWESLHRGPQTMDLFCITWRKSPIRLPSLYSVGLRFWVSSYWTVWLNTKCQLLFEHFFLHLYLFSATQNTEEVHFYMPFWKQDLDYDHPSSCKAVSGVLQGNRVTKGATWEVLQYTYLLIIPWGGGEAGCPAGSGNDVCSTRCWKKCQAENNPPNRYFTCCRNENTAQQQTRLTCVQEIKLRS